MELRFKSTKGFILTLTTVVLVILMLGEVVSFIYTSIQYNIISSYSSASSTDTLIYSNVNVGLSSFLSTSLRQAIASAAYYESTNSLNASESSSAVIKSLMMNGTINGVNVLMMSNYTFSHFVSTENGILSSQQVSISMTNNTIDIYQSNSAGINISYSGFVSINSSSGGISAPMSASVYVPLNSIEDIYSVLSSTVQDVNYSNAKATPLLNESLYASSASPYLSFYGTPYIYQPGGTPITYTCNYLYANVSNSISPSIILAVANAMSLGGGVCGFGGLITNNAPNGASIPYASQQQLIGSFSANLPEGSGGMVYSVLIDGALGNIISTTSLNIAARSGSYISSSYSPSYLSYLNGTYWQYSPFGVAALSTLSRSVLQLNNNANIIASNVLVNLTSGGTNTASMWIELNNNGINMVPFGFGDYYLYITPSSIGFSNGEGNIIGAQIEANDYFMRNNWVNIAAVFYNGVPSPSNDLLYIDGTRAQLISIAPTTSPAVATNTIYIGDNSIGAPYNGLIGQMANLQLYNSTLNPYQIGQLYMDGINGKPVNSNTLIGYWPFDGNLMDISAHSNNAITANSPYAPFAYGLFSSVTGYDGDSLSAGSIFNGQGGAIFGLMGCHSIANCNGSKNSLFYTGANPPYYAYSSNSKLNQSGSIGIGGAQMPGGAQFDQSSQSQISISSVAFNANGGGGNSVSFWMYWYGGNSIATPIYFNNFGIQGTGSCFGISTYNGGSIGTVGVSSTNAIVNRWVNIIATMPNGAVGGSDALYINGVQVPISQCTASAPSSITNPGSSMSIGGISGVSASFDGAISGVQVYNSILTSQQAVNLYLNSTVNSIIPTGYWPLYGGDNGYVNQTADYYGTSTGYMYTNGAICTNSNVILMQCGIELLPQALPQ